ncbi:MAG: hypothetical protein D6729_14565 [Deltaproteobacteria bacterium]|nr:MAG: hypothetical protein D6729_14565 [Deltaproteobacteria bacterium]
MSEKRDEGHPSGGPAAVDVAIDAMRHGDVIVAGPGAHGIALWLAEHFNRNFDAYDRAIDAVYDTTHVGGPLYHHILDGQHTLWGALHAVSGVSSSDSLLREAVEAGEHLLRDTFSVSGLNPLLTKDTFDAVASVGSHFGLTRAYLADALTLNGAEVIGGGLALAGVLLAGRRPGGEALAGLGGAYTVSALVSANPLLLGIAAASMAVAVHRSGAPDRRSILVAGGKGALVSGSALLASGLVGGPAWLGVSTAVLTGILVRSALRQPDAAAAWARQTATKARDLLGRARARVAALEIDLGLDGIRGGGRHG